MRSCATNAFEAVRSLAMNLRSGPESKSDPKFTGRPGSTLSGTTLETHMTRMGRSKSSVPIIIFFQFLPIISFNRGKYKKISELNCFCFQLIFTYLIILLITNIIFFCAVSATSC